ncbi:MAG: ABC transporter ATP-binding protein [Pseudomonadota bacterium]
MLDVRGLRVEFDGFRAVDDVSLNVAAGSIVGIAGTNGAGKSTLFAAIAGQVTPSHGSIAFDGHPVTRLAPSARARLGLARTFQIPREFGRLTVLENLLAAAPSAHETLRAAWFARAAARREEAEIARRADEVLALVGLAVVRDRIAANLSGGQKKLLELGRTLMRTPKCLLLDEPFAGVNPVLVEQLLHVLRAIHARGIALVVIEHHLQVLSSLVPRLIVMDQGRVIADGAPAVVLQDERVQAAYMGGVV